MSLPTIIFKIGGVIQIVPIHILKRGAVLGYVENISGLNFTRRECATTMSEMNVYLQIGLLFTALAVFFLLIICLCRGRTVVLDPRPDFAILKSETVRKEMLEQLGGLKFVDEIWPVDDDDYEDIENVLEGLKRK